MVDIVQWPKTVTIGQMTAIAHNTSWYIIEHVEGN